jgi:hypothetical protein
MPTGYKAGGVYDFAIAQMDLRFFDRKSEKRTQPRPFTWQ